MQIVTPDFKGENKGHYSAGVISNGTLYVSGQLSIDPDTREVCKGDIREHTRLALNNIKRVLDAAGVTTNDVVFCRIYTPDVNYRSTRNTPHSSANTSPAASLSRPRRCTSAVSSKLKPSPKCPPNKHHTAFAKKAASGFSRVLPSV